MLRKIVLHGALRRCWPSGVIELDAASVAEAISGMCRVTGGAFNPVPGKGRHEIVVQGYETVESLAAPLPDDVTELHLAPNMRGGKGGGFFQVAIGAVLIATALVMPETVALTETLKLSSSAVFFAGVSMMAGGVLAMMSPAPQVDMPNLVSGGNDPEASKYLGAPRNTVRIGTRIPIIAGKVKVGMHVLSLNIDAKDVAV